MKEQHGKKRAFVPVLGNIVSGLIGFGDCAGVGGDADEGIPQLGPIRGKS